MTKTANCKFMQGKMIYIFYYNLQPLIFCIFKAITAQFVNTSIKKLLARI